jgi:hypothetical protein
LDILPEHRGQDNMTENKIGGWHTYSWDGGSSIIPASQTGVLGLGFVPSDIAPSFNSKITITDANTTFSVIDLTETEKSEDATIAYRGGIQSIDKSFSSSPITIPIPEEHQTGYDIGFIDSAVITISGIWFDGLTGRDSYLEDLRTTKKIIMEKYRASPLVLLMSTRAYFVMLTGYSSNIIGGQGDIISFRLGLSICQLQGHYP